MKRAPLRKLLNHVRPGIPYYALASVIGVAVAALEQAVPVKLEGLVNGFIKDSGGLTAMVVPGLLIAGLMLGAQLSRYGQRVSAEFANSKVTASLIGRAFACLVARPIGWFAQEHTAILQGKLDRSARGIAELLRIIFSELLTSFIGVVMAVTLIFMTDTRVGLVVLVVVPLLACVTVAQARSQAGVRLKLEHWRQTIAKRIAEAFRGLEEIKLFRGEGEQSRRLAADLNDATGQEFVHHNAMAKFDLLKSLIDRGGFIMVLGLALISATKAQSSLGLGGVLMLTLLYDRAVDPIRHLHRIIDEGIERLQLVGIYLELVAVDPIERNPCASVNTSDILIDGVSFAYPGQTDEVLRSFSASIPAGSIVAVQGRSGCGKSTLQRLLSGLYVPTDGQINIGGEPVLPIEQRESVVTVLSQSPHIFAGSIKENLLFARPEATDDEIELAAKLARFHDEVIALPDAYDYCLGESGKGLSGGQKQRLALARVFLVDSPVVVLDEPTAALDPENAKRILGQIRDVFFGKTVIVVTHEAGALPWADYLLKFNESLRSFTFHKLGTE